MALAAVLLLPGVALATDTTRQLIQAVSSITLFVVSTIMVTHTLCVWRNAKWPWFLSPIVFGIVAALYIAAAHIGQDSGWWVRFLTVAAVIYLLCAMVRKKYGRT